jgi:hypothetical protein
MTRTTGFIFCASVLIIGIFIVWSTYNEASTASSDDGTAVFAVSSPDGDALILLAGGPKIKKPSKKKPKKKKKSKKNGKKNGNGDDDEEDCPDPEFPELDKGDSGWDRKWDAPKLA